MSKLPKKQQELLDALKRGVPVHYMEGWYSRKSYWFRGDTFQRVTATANALMDKGLARSKKVGSNVVLFAVEQDRAHA